MKELLKIILIMGVFFTNIVQAKERWEAFGINWKIATIEDIKDIDVNLEDDSQITPLHYAARYNPNIEIVQTLIKNGAKIEARNKWKSVPLHYAALGSPNPNIIDFLITDAKTIHLSEASNTDSDFFKALKESMRKTNISIDFNGANNKTPLHYAAKSNNLEMVKKLIDLGSKLNEKDDDGYTPLLLAAKYNGNPEIVTTLIDAGADKRIDNKNHKSFFTVALRDNNLEVVREIFNIPDENGKTIKNQVKNSRRGSIQVIFESAGNENIGVTKYLLDILDIDVNIKDINEKKSLFSEVVSKNNNPEVIKELIGLGADINEKDENGESVFSLHDKKVLRVLINAGMEMDFDGLSVRVALKGHDNNIWNEENFDLLSNFVKADLKDEYDNTVLHYAIAHNKDLKTIKALINAGAKIDAKNKDGQTPLYYSTSKQTINFLVEKTLDGKKSISKYQSLIDNFSNNTLYKDIIERMTKDMQTLVFKDANSKDTIEAYNEFIIKNPNAAQVSKANNKAYGLEKSKYSGWFSSDEKNSRALYIKINQFNKQKKGSNAKRGYNLIIQRMGKLLQDLFPAELATMNFVESSINASPSAEAKETLAPQEYPLILTAHLSKYGSSNMSKLRQISNKHTVNTDFRLLPTLEIIKANSSRVNSGKFADDRFYSEIAYKAKNGDTFRSYDFTNRSEKTSKLPNWVKQNSNRIQKFIANDREVNGLPNYDSSKVLFTKKNDDGELSIFVQDLQTKKIQQFAIGTTVKKCIWSGNNIDFYCAVPRREFDENRWDNTNIGLNRGYFSRDDIIKINSETGLMEIIFDSIIEGKSFDFSNLKIGDREKYLFWVDKRTGFAWSYDMYY